MPMELSELKKRSEMNLCSLLQIDFVSTIFTINSKLPIDSADKTYVGQYWASKDTLRNRQTESLLLMI